MLVVPLAVIGLALAVLGIAAELLEAREEERLGELEDILGLPRCPACGCSDRNPCSRECAFTLREVVWGMDLCPRCDEEWRALNGLDGGELVARLAPKGGVL